MPRGTRLGHIFSSLLLGFLRDTWSVYSWQLAKIVLNKTRWVSEQNTLLNGNGLICMSVRSWSICIHCSTYLPRDRFQTCDEGLARGRRKASCMQVEEVKIGRPLRNAQQKRKQKASGQPAASVDELCNGHVGCCVG